MRVKMLANAPGSPDGIVVNDYEQGTEYDVTDSLAVAFVNHRLAEEVTEATKPKRTKKGAGPSENK